MTIERQTDTWCAAATDPDRDVSSIKLMAFLGKLIGGATLGRLGDLISRRPVIIRNMPLTAALALLSGFVRHAIIKMIYLPETPLRTQASALPSVCNEPPY